MIVDSIIHYNRGSHYDIHQDANTVIIKREYVNFLMAFLSANSCKVWYIFYAYLYARLILLIPPDSLW